MAQVHLHIPSFNAGELSPLLGARFAVEKIASGCRKCRNFIPHVHGPAFRRPGMEYMGPSAGDGARSSLRGFNFSTTTGFVLEFHPSGLKVWSNGVSVPLVSPVALPYSESECAELQIAQVNDVCYIAHPSYTPKKLTRWADNDWRLSEISWKWPALGDENVRSTEVATPVVTLRGSEVATEEWPEFTIPASTAYSFEISGSVDTSRASKTVTLQRWSGSDWVKVKAFTWTTVAPAAAYSATSPATETKWRIIHNEKLAIGGQAEASWSGGSSTLLLDSADRPSREAATIPAGEWQMTVECAAVLTKGATLKVQKKVNGAWQKSRTGSPIYAYTIEMKPGRTIIVRGEALLASTDFRFVWAGRAMAGVARFESIAFPTSTDVTIACNGTNGTGRTLTASSAIFKPGHVGSYWQIAHRREASGAEILAAVPTISAAESDVIRVSGKWEVYTYGSWNTTLYLERKVSGTWETIRSWTSRKDRNVVASGEEDSEVEMRLRVEAGTGEAATGADVPRFVLETSDARVTGLVKITAIGALDSTGKATTATADVVTDLYATTATALWTEGAWSPERGYPRTVALHGQRLWFGGTVKEPLRLWGSAVNDYENFRRTSLDDAGVSFVPAAQQSNRLQWMVSHGENLVLGTNGDEWTVSGGTDKGPITPTSVQIQRRSGYGSRYLPALLLGEVIVFVQRGGRKMRQVAPRAGGIEWTAADLTVLAEHVAREGIRQTAVMQHPQTILWAVTEDGRLLGMTFETEQNVFAWHVHTTDGKVESVGVVYGESADEVWLQVRRNGKRSIERLDPRAMGLDFSEPETLIYSDAAKVVELAAAGTTVTGLDHLEGRDVCVLADGADVGTARVVNGTITLEAEATTVVAGLPYLSELQPMRVEVPLRDGTSQGRRWRTSRVGMYLHESLGGEVGDGDGARFEKLNFREVGTAMETVPPLYTGEKETPIAARTRAGVDVIARTQDPLPFNIGSMWLDLDIYD